MNGIELIYWPIHDIVAKWLNGQYWIGYVLAYRWRALLKNNVFRNLRNQCGCTANSHSRDHMWKLYRDRYRLIQQHIHSKYSHWIKCAASWKENRREILNTVSSVRDTEKCQKCHIISYHIDRRPKISYLINTCVALFNKIVFTGKVAPYNTIM